MSMVKLVCGVCGKEFIVDTENYGILGLKNLPKRCPECIDKKNQLKKVVVERQMIKEYYVTTESVEDALTQLVKEPLQDSESQYEVYSMGGRGFGSWGGAGFSEKYLVFVHKSVISGSCAIARVRLMKKVIQKDTNTYEHIYVAIDPAEQAGEIGSLVVYPKKIWKTTLKGYGRQWVKNYVLIGEYDVLLSTSSYARSERFGNIYEMCYVVGSYEIVKHCKGDC